MTGFSVSSVQVTVRETEIAALPQASLTFQVRVWERVQPVLVTALSVKVGLPTVQLSAAVAKPRAARMVAESGLQPKVEVVPVAVMTGAVVSSTVIVCVNVAIAPQGLVALHVRVTML